MFKRTIVPVVLISMLLLASAAAAANRQGTAAPPAHRNCNAAATIMPVSQPTVRTPAQPEETRRINENRRQIARLQSDLANRATRVYGLVERLYANPTAPTPERERAVQDWRTAMRNAEQVLWDSAVRVRARGLSGNAAVLAIQRVIIHGLEAKIAATDALLTALR